MKLNVNGTEREVDAPADMPLLWVLRDLMGLTGTKFGCGIAQCGACTVHVDGAPLRACITPVAAVAGKKITTIEGLSADGQHPVQQAWAELDVVQCGYCQSGTDHVRGGVAGEDSHTHRYRYRPGPVRQHLPLRHLSAHPRGGASRGGDRQGLILSPSPAGEGLG